jgi:RNA polymerase sigma factor (sigma-70 family)
MHEQLIHECLAGNRQSQSALYAIFANKMFALCLRYAATRTEAEDILQEGFIKVFACLHQFRRQGSLEGWIRAIMINCALSRFRQKKSNPLLLPANMQHPDIPDREHILSGLQVKDLLQLISKLPPTYRMVFNLYVFEGFQHKEIATALGISEGSSKSNLHDARLILQKQVNAASTRVSANLAI